MQFDTGVYEYDASGNVWQIGNDRYTYDVADRLISGTVYHGSAGTSEVNTYDGFDNVVETVFDGDATSPARYYADAKNRILGGTAGEVNTAGWGGARTPARTLTASRSAVYSLRFCLQPRLRR